MMNNTRLGAMTDAWMRKIDQLVEAVGDHVDAVLCTMTSGRTWGASIIFHSCGSVYQHLSDLIDAGVRILNPVQLGAKDMEAEKLKREFGRDLVFWGGAIDPQHTLARGTPAQVREEARRNIEVFKKGGGFLFNNPHNVLSNVSAENVVALYDAATEFGRCEG